MCLARGEHCHRIVMSLTCVFVVLCLLCVQGRFTAEVSATGTPSCEDVKTVFVDKHIGTLKDTTDMSHEEETPLCSGSWNSSCCTPTMERRYSEASRKEFQRMLQASNAALQLLLSSSADSLKETFAELIHASHNNTRVLFSEVYKRLDSASHDSVSRLYGDLSQHVAGVSRDDLPTVVSRFFDRLFPLVYHHSINPKLKDFSAEYKECLAQTRKEIRPFGEIADRVSAQITRSFTVARTLLEALETGLDVIRSTGSMSFRPDCNAGLAKMVYCSHCAGHSKAKPCTGYCLNVVRGCLAHVAELDQPWSDFVSGVERLTSGLVADYNIEEVVSKLDTRISEAIMYAMENGPELSKKVKSACGHPHRTTRDVSPPPQPSAAPASPGRIVPVRPATRPSLYGRLRQLATRLAESKGHFANVADGVCGDESWSVREEGRCWNGLALGQYTRSIAGVGVSAQKYNPEMSAPASDDLLVSALDEKLQRQARVLRVSATPELPQADAYVGEGGSGSGATWGGAHASDDEDYADGSGSGDGTGTKPSDFNFDNGEPRSNVNIKEKDSGALSATMSTSTLSLCLLLVTFLLTPGRFW